MVTTHPLMVYMWEILTVLPSRARTQRCYGGAILSNVPLVWIEQCYECKYAFDLVTLKMSFSRSQRTHIREISSCVKLTPWDTLFLFIVSFVARGNYLSVEKEIAKTGTVFLWWD